ncbi:ABC1 kinase family protein [Streptomyces xanthochromogenes]
MDQSRRAHQIAQVLWGLAYQEVGRSLRCRTEDAAADEGRLRRARTLADALESLGPFYIKIGQILSTRPDVVPAATATELQKLHDQVSCGPFVDFEPVLTAELGSRWPSLFRDIDTGTPLGSASLAQVYGAELADGTPVAVKIQRPGVRDVVEADMALLRRIARFAGKRAPKFNAVIDIDAMLKVIFDAMRPELDFCLEAENMRTAAAHTQDFKHITVPRALTATPRVLIQSLAPGCSIRDADPAAFTTQERTDLGHDLLSFMYRGYFIRQFFHADPHPGNIFVHPGHPACLIDWGMVGRLDRPLSHSVLRVLMCLAQNDGAGVAKAWVEMGHPTPWAQLADFEGDMAALVPQIATASLGELDFGLTLTSVLERSTRRDIKTSPMVSILGKSFANIEGSIRHLCPELSLIDVFQDELPSIIFHLASEHLSAPQAARTLLELMSAGGQMPQQIRGIITALADRELSVNVNQGPTKTDMFCGSRARRSALLTVGALLWWHRSRR